MKTNNQKGYSVIEFIFIVALLIVFGLTTFTLLVAGSKAYESISDQKEVQSELRLASSYIAMKIRQNDIQGSLSVESNPFNGGQSLRIKEWVEQKEYDTWVYYDNGKLLESTLETGLTLESTVGFEIAAVDDLSMSLDPETKLIRIDVSKALLGKPVHYVTSIKIKSLMESEVAGNE